MQPTLSTWSTGGFGIITKYKKITTFKIKTLHIPSKFSKLWQSGIHFKSLGSEHSFSSLASDSSRNPGFLQFCTYKLQEVLPVKTVKHSQSFQDPARKERGLTFLRVGLPPATQSQYSGAGGSQPWSLSLSSGSHQKTRGRAGHGARSSHQHLKGESRRKGSLWLQEI